MAWAPKSFDALFGIPEDIPSNRRILQQLLANVLVPFEFHCASTVARNPDGETDAFVQSSYSEFRC